MELELAAVGAGLEELEDVVAGQTRVDGQLLAVDHRDVILRVLRLQAVYLEAPVTMERLEASTQRKLPDGQTEGH